MIILYCFLGVIAGTITGLIPGIHSNNITVLLLLSPFFGTEITIFVLSMSIVQTFVDFIPSVFLGAPSTETFEGVLPGHKMLLQGKGFEAVCLTVFGGIVALISCTLLMPIFILFIQNNTSQIIYVTPIILTFTLMILILSEQSKNKKIIALFVILAATTQGFLFKEQIFPLITGYFGLPTIIYSLKHKKTKVTTIEQETHLEINKSLFVEGIIGVLGGAIVSIMPGIGSNVAAGIIKTFRQKIASKNYLVLLGSINSANFFFSFPMLYFLSKTRNGSMIFLKERAFLTEQTLFVGLETMVIAGALGAIITILLSKKAISFFTENKTTLFSFASIIAMITIVFLFNGFEGIIALFFAGALGMLVVLKKVKRSCCMSALIVPVLFFYLFTLI